MKRTIRLTESELHRIVNKTVQNVLNEATPTMPHDDLMMAIDYDPYRGNSVFPNYTYEDPYYRVHKYDGKNRPDTDYHDIRNLTDARDCAKFAKAWGDFCLSLENFEPSTRNGREYKTQLQQELRKIEWYVQALLKKERMKHGLPAKDPYRIEFSQRNYRKPKQS